MSHKRGETGGWWEGGKVGMLEGGKERSKEISRGVVQGSVGWSQQESVATQHTTQTL